MKALFAIALFVNAYAIVYYRLLVKFYYEKQHGTREGNWGALFSFPPYKALPEKGRRYARRYWVAVGILMLCVAALAYLSDFSYLSRRPL